jgi:hypothetical protein
MANYKDGQKVKVVVGSRQYPSGTEGTISVDEIGTVWVVVGLTQQGGVKRFKLDDQNIGDIEAID